MEPAGTKRELAETRMELEILKKAAAYFANGSLPGTRRWRLCGSNILCLLLAGFLVYRQVGIMHGLYPGVHRMRLDADKRTRNTCGPERL